METCIDRKDGTIVYLGKRRQVRLHGFWPGRATCEEYGVKKLEAKLQKCAEVESSRVFPVSRRLSTILDRNDMTLDDDFAPLSFTFHGQGLYGGIIFHGVHDRGGDGGAPTFSVNLGPVDGWAIHT